MLLPFQYQKLYRVTRWGRNSGDNPQEAAYEEADGLDTANVVSSQLRLGGSPTGGFNYHRPVLDIDIPAALIDSSTPGQHHLYLDVCIPWDTYVKLLDVMAECGILQPGYVAASKERGFTAVRLPWIRK